MTNRTLTKKIYVHPFSESEHAEVNKAYHITGLRKPEFWKKVIVKGSKAILEETDGADSYH